MRNLGLLAARGVLGGYLAVHGAQKLFGAFGGHGIEATAKGFESMGLRPGKAMATLAGASELGGGILTATGVANPLGPLSIAGTMAVATAVHRAQGPLAQKGGFELPLTNLALATALMVTGPGRFRAGPRLHRTLTRLAVIGGVALTAAALARLLRSQPAAESHAEAAPPKASADDTSLDLALTDTKEPTHSGATA